MRPAHYLDQPSPLRTVLQANSAFFDVFGDFPGFVDHFLLQDLLSDDGRSVNFFMPFDDFNGPSKPGDVETYKVFREKSVAFIHARNQRILELANHLP